MKALSVRQPYATALASGEKTIECRTWKTPYRGEFVLCASKGLSKFELDDGTPIKLIGGHAIAVLELVNVRPFEKKDIDAALMHPDDFEQLQNAYAWDVKLLYPIIPVPVKGKLHFFDVDIPIEKIPEKYGSIYDSHINWLLETYSNA